MSIRLLLIAALCWPLHAMSASVSYSSDIPELLLVGLETLGGTQFAGIHLIQGDQQDPVVEDFIQYCDGIQNVYVSSLNGPVKCKSGLLSDTRGFDIADYGIRFETKDPRLSGLYLISKKPLPPRIKSLPVTKNELEKLKKAEKLAKASLEKDGTLSTLAGIKRNFPDAKKVYRKYIDIRYKFSTPSGFIYISTIGLNDGALAWDMVNVVFREIDGKLQNIGSIIGCIEGFRDLNADGTPEVLTSTCESGEGNSSDFWSLTPEIRSVVSFSEG